MVASGLLFASLVTFALGKPATRNLKLHEALEGPPSGYSLTGSVDLNQSLKLRLALIPSNTAELERKLYDVSTPSSPNYGKHLSKSEVRCPCCSSQSKRCSSLLALPTGAAARRSCAGQC